MSVPSEGEILELIQRLEAIVESRDCLSEVDREIRHRLFAVAGKIAHPGRAARREITRAHRQKRREELDGQKDRDRAKLEETGIRRSSSVPGRSIGASPRPVDAIELSPEAELNQVLQAGVEPVEELEAGKSCYVCKERFRQVHHFYDALCPTCAEFNWDKRQQTANMRGRIAFLTGGRVKIGFHVGLKLLRAGATLIVTSRFPQDAARRYLEQPDSKDWWDRLHIHGVDLRDTPAVWALARRLESQLTHLDFLINNACQTVRRPPQFYDHLMQAERQRSNEDPRVARLLASSLSEQGSSDAPRLADTTLTSGAAMSSNTAAPPEQHLPDSSHSTSSERTNVGERAGSRVHGSAEMSQIPLTPSDFHWSEKLFPTGALDSDQQQIDLRTVNSWRLRLAEVAPVELVEVHLVNAIAPFVLNAALKPLMLRTAARDKHIVNVSAMEGVFYRAFKQDTHPHTNMAKASLNMMTRTSAMDYVRDGIHMNSVDTGWITDEDPAEIAQRKHDELDFHPPLDYEDAAARICDPIFSGLNSGEHVWGVFLKDYKVSNW